MEKGVGKTTRWWVFVMTAIWLVVVMPAALLGNKFTLFELLSSVFLASGVGLMLPCLLSVGVFRKHLYWPDAMTEDQHRAWQSGRVIASYNIALRDDYKSKLAPYVYKLGFVSLLLGLFQTGINVIDLSIMWLLLSILTIMTNLLITVPYRLLINLARLG